MGLLTDPSGGQGKFAKTLLKCYKPLCIVLYGVGVVWFCALASPSMNYSTYLSENALLPGLVKLRFQEDDAAMRYYEDLRNEMQKYPNDMPSSWILAKFRQIGLDAYTHNFSLSSPLILQMYLGNNVYGILRAPRAASTEALILSAPYRPLSSVHPTTVPSIALMLAFAKYAIKEKFWAKDIIFLITEHEQLGIQAWLESYHGVTCGSENVLNHGDLKGHAGAIQAAINLELHSIKIGYIDIKIEGLNGQLPNLDLYNLATKMCIREGIIQTFKNQPPERYRTSSFEEYLTHFKNMLLMAGTQATGIPNGNHGLFLRFGIQALTLEGSEWAKASTRVRVGFLGVGRILENIFRSMNNLLERFHQSFFFYLLPSTDRFISIGLYMPSICLIAGVLIIKAYAKWCKLQEDLEDPRKDTESKSSTRDAIAYVRIIVTFIAMHLFGMFLLNLPTFVAATAVKFGYPASQMVFYSLAGASGAGLLVPLLLGNTRTSEVSMNILCTFSLLELGTALICIAMNNFSLGLFCGIVSVPFALFITPTKCRHYARTQRIIWLVVHPLTVLYGMVLLNTHFLFPNGDIREILARTADAAQQAVVYSVVDSMIYGNWMFTVVTTIFIPNWLCFWCVAFSSVRRAEVSVEKKTN
ncbi:glycosylphosphatidylinositol anchor attachment 1 protein isoform X2 [Cylas formicarius]|uniref:glycosylphosphatidylinositol anchor attachment 1 protein isoform X2 n=1 Tax=Cylas formicarius TaxID=197179 RepID=UPI002958D3A0|nr:glycosylphosphatidylinositol anchor attachment 1 protein isoform X2 [Cylas formicarius]